MPTREEFLNNLDPVSNPAKDLTCPICDPEPPVNLIRLPCHETHIYCRSCIVLWLQQRGVNTCPQCRTELFDLPKAELPAEDDEDDEDYDDVDEDGARVVDLDEEFYDHEEDEDDSGSLAGDYHVEDEDEAGDDPDPGDAAGQDDEGGEDSNAREQRQSALLDEMVHILGRPFPRGPNPGRRSPGVHYWPDNPPPLPEEADTGDANIPDADDQDEHRDRAPYPRQRWRQQWRRHRRYGSNDEDEGPLVADEAPSRSLPRPSPLGAGADEVNSATNLGNLGIGVSNGGDDEAPEPDSPRNRSASSEQPADEQDAEQVSANDNKSDEDQGKV